MNPGEVWNAATNGCSALERHSSSKAMSIRW